MKKNRPAYLLSVLCTESIREAAEEIIFTHTTTIGIRRSFMERTVLKRECQTVETPAWDGCCQGVQSGTERENLSQSMRV